MRKIRPCRVRSSYARSKARMYHREMNWFAPPIVVVELIEQYGKVKWHKDAGDGFTLYDPRKRKKYIVSIDETMVQGRITWTLCHELAHIVLGHFIGFDMDNLSDRENFILDREADIFVTEFLMPEEWVSTFCGHPLTLSGLGKLVNTFNVSWEAMINRLDELGFYSKSYINRLFGDRRVVREEPAEYHVNIGHRRKVTIAINYCTAQIRGRRLVPITIPKIDQNFRFLECPFCGNAKFSEDAKYCMRCGFYLYNTCTNLENDPREHSNWCGRPNVPDALYCEYCGAVTQLGQALQMEESKKQVAATMYEKANQNKS